MSASGNYKNLIEQMQSLKLQAKDAAEQAMQEGLREVFEAYPQVHSIGWTQYTPYFNDGAPCTFRVNAEDPAINGYDYWDMDEEESKECELPFEVMEKVCERAGEILSAFENDTFLALYGDHVRVTFLRNGEAQLEEYDHD
jgi:hypothetical protein